jgi:hypothetical protein
MKTRRTTVLMGALAGAVLLLTSSTAGAQSKTLQGESETVTATIEAIDQSSRTITVKDDKGIYETLDVGPGVARFNELKVGDKITARYYENVVVRVKKPGEPAVDVASGALTRSQATPGGTAAAQRTITVTVTAMDPKARSVTVKGPNNYVYSRRVQDKKVFDQLKVGDRLDMTWTNALLLSAEPPKK